MAFYVRCLGALCAALVVGGLSACARDGSADAASGSPGPPDGSRSATVRIYQGGEWTVPGETPKTVGAALAKLKPTYVGNLVRYQADENITEEQVDGYNTVREAVLATSPDATFSIELNALEYKTAADVEKMMDTVRDRFDVDGWFFDFYTTAAQNHADVLDAAIENAHDHGEYLGGNAFGISGHPPIPEGTDFVAVQDSKFKIDLAAVRELAKRVPVGFHLGNAPELADSDGCVFIQQYSTAQRTAYIKERAGQQQANSFEFGYPVFFPECERDSSSNNPGVYAYDALKDTPMLDTINELMDRYDGAN